MTLKIISAEEVLFEGAVSAVHLPGVMGEFTVLPNHASLVSLLREGNVTMTRGENVKGSLPIAGGIADIDHNVISVCVY